MAKASSPQKRSFSKPVLDQTLTIHSQNAQYVLQRGHSFLLVVRALYALSVVLRIIGEDAEMDQIEALVSERIETVAKRLQDEHARLKALADEEGGVPIPRYTHPRAVTLQLSSPQLAQYVRLVLLLDKTLMLLDGLWFAGVLSNKQRKNATHDSRRLVYGLGRSLIDLERRARDSALRAGKQAELQAADEAVTVLATGSLVDGHDEAQDLEQPPAETAAPTEIERSAEDAQVQDDAEPEAQAHHSAIQ
ncbi:hypothetical protein F2Q65_01330 [Thiohalocapsa marina]|uniref:DUF1845 domain-containing protein n=1 Tax=Thiohalocapsa marina TaxID=424902 RepID=A0A5M8FVP3_9GAMM|nr:hypothetical protein [Thiohalocapsa marina]KAA6187901.1 hypothetical protein F2Q65_01330 [Thiohalocapsa marina]